MQGTAGTRPSVTDASDKDEIQTSCSVRAPAAWYATPALSRFRHQPAHTPRDSRRSLTPLCFILPALRRRSAPQTVFRGWAPSPHSSHSPATPSTPSSWQPRSCGSHLWLCSSADNTAFFTLQDDCMLLPCSLESAVAGQRSSVSCPAFGPRSNPGERPFGGTTLSNADKGAAQGKKAAATMNRAALETGCSSPMPFCRPPTNNGLRKIQGSFRHASARLRRGRPDASALSPRRETLQDQGR